MLIIYRHLLLSLWCVCPSLNVFTHLCIVSLLVCLSVFLL